MQKYISVCLLSVMLAYLSSQSLLQSEEEWVSLPEFNNKLPSSLQPIFEALTHTSGECSYYCHIRNCSSFGFSQRYKSCKLYEHNNSIKPLPALKNDWEFQHQMYYKRNFCPPGWEMDIYSKICYLVAASSAETKQRLAAWETCETNMFSSMVTFETKEQRDRLYTILAAKYTHVSKWWTGYAMFDSNLWPRPLEEISGYVKRRGDCPNNNVYTPCKVLSPLECAAECDRKYRDNCVGFVHNGDTGVCCLKFNSCPNSGLYDNVESNKWFYDKVHAGRPPMVTKNGDCSGNNIRTIVGVTPFQCTEMCRSDRRCVRSAYQSSSKTCAIKFRPCVGKSASSYDTYDFRYINPGPCPFGLRVRDQCLVRHRSSGNFGTMANLCRRAGGKMITPIDRRKNEMAWNIHNLLGGNNFFDFVDGGQEGNWTTHDRSHTFTDPSWQRWGWTPGQPAGGAADNCVNLINPFNTANGVGVLINDAPCSNSYFTICETPISQSWPKDCRFTTPGREYMGSVSVTQSGIPCKPWSSTPYTGGNNWQRFPEWHTEHSFCRNPDPSVVGTSPWCYRQDNDQPESCEIPLCPESDWAVGQTFTNNQMPYAAINLQNGEFDWTTELFTATANPICSLRMSDWCPYYYQGSCYQFYPVNYNFADARAICQKQGWYMVSITTRDEQNFISGIVMSQGMQWVVPAFGWYIGLQGTSPTVWDSGEPLTVNFWSSRNGAPEDCHFLRVNVDGNWFDHYCWQKTYFICETILGE